MFVGAGGATTGRIAPAIGGRIALAIGGLIGRGAGEPATDARAAAPGTGPLAAVAGRATGPNP